jgi:tetratricopeptide (TPR) repeat protein
VAAFGLGFGLLAILIHSLSDFGQHVPANALVTAVFAGLLVGLAQFRQPVAPPRPPARAAKGVRVFARALGGVGTVVIAVMCLGAADGARRAEGAWNRALQLESHLDDQGWEQATNADYAALIGTAAEAVNLAPTDVTYRFWLSVYRWRSISRTTDPVTEALVMTSDELDFTRRIVVELHSARACCATFGPVYAFAGQLERSVLARPEGEGHIRTGYRLAAYDPGICLAAAVLDAEEAHWDDSIREARRAIELDGRLWQEVAETYLRLARPDLAHAAAAGNAAALARLAERLEPLTDQRELAAQCRTESTALMRARAERPDAPAATLADLAELYARDGRDVEAIEWYRQALVLEYGQVDWRIRLARLLDKAGQLDEAVRQARVCLRLRPEMPEARALIVRAGDRRTQGDSREALPVGSQPDAPAPRQPESNERSQDIR